MEEDEPQKPKQTTNGKQMAFHSYSTRSAVKRTLHSDDNSSGSQAQQPPVKRYTRPGAKQAGKSVEIANNDPTQDSNSVVTNAVNEYAHASANALQIGLVLESLFRYVNRSDLLSCRVVNKQWQDEGTKELRRRKLVIRFHFRRHENKMSRNIAFQNICSRLSKCRTPSLLSSIQVKTVALSDLGSGKVESIFPTIGNKLKHLTLHLSYSKNMSSFKSSLMTDLQNLLFRQAPNLEFLEIKFDFPWNYHWKDELQASDSYDRPQNCNNEFLLLPNLKTFIASGSPAPKFFADVINAATNLRSFEGAWSACIKYLLGADGRTKIHLLKSLRFGWALNPLVGWSQPDLELMETFLTEQKKNLKLESFECSARFENTILASRYFNVVNQILVYSSESLKKLIIIDPMKCLEGLLILPLLPNLKEISFHCYFSTFDQLGGGTARFFPRGFSMNNSFPNVSSIVLLDCNVPLFPLFVFYMERDMEIEMTEPIRSIRRIVVVHARKDSSSVSPRASDFHHIFPRLLSVSYADHDHEKYYKI